MELKQFWLKTLGDGIESVKLVTSDLIRGSPSLSKWSGCCKNVKSNSILLRLYCNYVLNTSP